ncbi:hypothetical protein [Nitrogeniibacter aestuarii]|uniref:hypothetical protein n=1 Tax=Nitrogeniibacter aestuarii TaxID=2815343 RepID=UPI001D10C039|nr:hypothetical protein [Nitrogeniibacter aestuarii]
MGRVPLLVLLTACTALFACTPEADPPDPPPPVETTEAVRDAGQAARDAVKKAGEALRRLGGGSSDNDTDAASVEPVPEIDPVAPAVEPVVAPPVPDVAPEGAPPAADSVSSIEPIPDETQQLEDAQHIQVERDASVATQEAKEKILEATRRAAERVRQAGAGMVDAFRKDEGNAQTSSDTMGPSEAGSETGPAPTETPANPPRPE